MSSTCTSCVAGTYSSLSGMKYLVARIKSLLSFSVAPYWQRATHRTVHAKRQNIDILHFCTDYSCKLVDLILTAPTVAQVKPMSLRVPCAILEHIHRDLVRLISSV